jgi:tripartite-type tricarboxylate transporter receptor subunit TctC
MRFRFREIILAGVFLAGFGLASQQALAQSGRPVRIIVPFPPGGSADVLARIVSQSAGESTRQTFIVENHPGAGASIAYNLTARAAPDGNTIVVGSNSLLINPLLRKVNYDSLTSFAPICNLVASPLIFVVNSTSAYKSIDEFIAAATAKPGAITVAALGPATTQHIAFEGFRRATKTEMVFVPFAGGAPAVNALLGNHVDAALINYSEGVEQIKAGKLRALATASSARLSPAPDVPTVAESGYPGYASEVWLGLLAPAGTPADAVDRLSGWFAAAMKQPAVQAKLEAVGLYPTVTCGKDFAGFLAAKKADYARIIAEANISVDK